MMVYSSSRGQGCHPELHQLAMTPLSHNPDFVFIGQPVVLYLDDVTVYYTLPRPRLLRTNWYNIPSLSITLFWS